MIHSYSIKCSCDSLRYPRYNPSSYCDSLFELTSEAEKGDCLFKHLVFAATTTGVKMTADGEAHNSGTMGSIPTSDELFSSKKSLRVDSYLHKTVIKYDNTKYDDDYNRNTNYNVAIASDSKTYW